MVRPRSLIRPPIVEALVDLRAAVPGDSKMFGALADELKDEFPTKQQRRNFQASIEFKDGKLVSPRVDSTAFGGVRVANGDRTILVQFRPDGFTLNNMKVYLGGDELIHRALTFWELLVKRAPPEFVSRVALRYINRLELTLEPGDQLTRYLTSPPGLPGDMSGQVNEFLSRIVGYDEQRKATAVVTQQLKRRKPGQPVAITVDIDVFQTGNFSVSSAPLREILDSLRELKNEMFFSSLTEETVSTYE